MYIRQFYVNYYEGICAGFPCEQKALTESCAKTLSGFGQVIWDGQLIGDTGLATSGRFVCLSVGVRSGNHCQLDPYAQGGQAVSVDC